MISLSRLNGKSFVLNCDLIKSIEATPDTVITLINQEKHLVKESVSEVIELTVDYRKRLYGDLPKGTH
jgi:flagellar protein FlbD